MAVARMQLVTKWTHLGNPLIILVAAFLLSIAIFALIPVNEPKFGGGSQASPNGQPTAGGSTDSSSPSPGFRTGPGTARPCSISR